MADVPSQVLISLTGPDRVGLIAEVTAALFSLGANLGDTAFAVLGKGFEFSCLAELPAGVSGEDVAATLHRLPTLTGAAIRVSGLPFEPEADERGDITHVIEVEGGDRPGLIARMSEVFAQFDVNVVRMNSKRVLGPSGPHYLTVFAVAMPPERATSCLAAAHNTAGQLNLMCRYRTA
jgi:glycine cleavage system transcriptional repressor